MNPVPGPSQSVMVRLADPTFIKFHSNFGGGAGGPWAFAALNPCFSDTEGGHRHRRITGGAVRGAYGQAFFSFSFFHRFEPARGPAFVQIVLLIRERSLSLAGKLSLPPIEPSAHDCTGMSSSRRAM